MVILTAKDKVGKHGRREMVVDLYFRCLYRRFSVSSRRAAHTVTLNVNAYVSFQFIGCTAKSESVYHFSLFLILCSGCNR